MNGLPPVPGLWQEARTPDGRAYYYNTQTKVTQWTKPEELLTPAERALKDQPWKEYTAEGGRKYWYNTETKQSSWEMPDVYRNAIAQTQPPARPAAPAQTFVAGGTSNFASQSHHRDRDDFHERLGPDRQIGWGQSETRETTRIPLNSQTDPEYSSFDEAQAAFKKLLKRAGVQLDWSWEQTMRATIKDPQYRAIKDPKDRKAAFEQYVVDMRVQEKEEEKKRVEQLRERFGQMLRSHPEIKHFTRWKTAKPILEGEAIFNRAKTEDEARQLFEEYIVELNKTHAEEEVKKRTQAADELASILNDLQLEPYTRWSEAQEIIRESERFKGDEKFESLSQLDILKAFENHIKSLERSFNDARQKQKSLKARRERQNRDQFIALLREVRADGKIKAGTKWKEIHPLVVDDARYVAMLGQPGSTPLDLFWDMVEEEERVLRGKRHDVLDVLDDRRFEITQKTTLEEFMSIMQADRRTANIDQHSLTLLFQRLLEKVHQRNEEDKHHAERSQRRAVDTLRSRIKHLEPPVILGDTWEQVRPRLEKFEEYRALDSDEVRRSAFDKYMRRLKEKEEDRERERSRRDHRDRERGDRYRDDRNGYAPSRRHRTRTPEPDAYEADRRKAQADRERSYRKASLTGLSPRRDRDYRDRDDRGSRPMDHYDRERRVREVERERSYISRADPRDKGSELDYGESRAGSMRRRRDSDGGSPESKRDVKRTRRDRSSRERTFSPRPHRSRTPAKEAPPPKEDVALRSGSEEGEIEED
ncbi:uncharacterized protein K452DRAFT_305530 [Aplosporella prunicola CBS 121167]|uniref:Formin binding protein n=1 Tax=Aplosporella prunicola CBS 121167 TaxID=1176127 RepID=A0A6A6BRT3_9PEZI|nr:uncharacterized protein K452DRAFT_305530 [Aplosporella prunicola CBS 121167]KAF2145527.1 hypothetical protein K452DRAFT_305530 [Aplosporella prunicola CBS 121167]